MEKDDLEKIKKEIARMGGALREASMDYFDPKHEMDLKEVNGRVQKISNRLRNSIGNYKMILIAREIGKLSPKEFYDIHLKKNK